MMESIWMEDTKIRRRGSLPGDMEASAVVIGAGLAGILTAYYLKQAGIRAVVLEADRVGGGQTKNTTAKITSQHSLIYDKIIRMFGRRMAEYYANANEAAIGEYERLILEKGIDCDFVRCPSYLYSRIDTEPLKREAEAAESLGIRASFGTDCELPFTVAGVTKFENQARLHPLKFLAGMAEEVEVYEQTKVLKVEDRRVETANGCVTAEHIIFASHFPFINVPGYYFARMYQERSYVVALEGTENLEGMYLGIDRDGLSFRTCGELLLLGGGSHRTGVYKRSKADSGCKYEMLRRKAREIYPGCHEVLRWSAQEEKSFNIRRSGRMGEEMILGKREFFYGWYFKCQSDTQTMAVIPAFHRTGKKRSCSIQIITEERSWTVSFPAEEFRRRGRMISIGKNRFGERGIRLAVCSSGLNVKGKLKFGPLFPLRYDIMGPFSFVPFLECRHSIWSMKHAMQGIVCINGKAYSFDKAEGYWEGDRGRSFPKEYIWTQCSFPGGELMLAVADIPIAGFHFQGIIGIVLLDGREYRLATYLGAKVTEIRNGKVRVVQGRLELEAELLERKGNPLKAPAWGAMVRTIHENVACRAKYCFRKDNRTLLACETDRASFEYEYRV